MTPTFSSIWCTFVVIHVGLGFAFEFLWSTDLIQPCAMEAKDKWRRERELCRCLPQQKLVRRPRILYHVLYQAFARSGQRWGISSGGERNTMYERERWLNSREDKRWINLVTGKLEVVARVNSRDPAAPPEADSTKTLKAQALAGRRVLLWRHHRLGSQPPPSPGAQRRSRRRSGKICVSCL